MEHALATANRYINTRLLRNATTPASAPKNDSQQKPPAHKKMQLAHVKLAIFVVAALALAFWCTEAEATYRKPPFNGSIFGKRGTVTADVDNAGKALSAMCEIASEACQTWFSSQEK